MRKIIFFLLIAVFLLRINVYAESPYDLSWQNEGIALGLGLATGIPALILADNSDTLTRSDILLLDKNNINGFDRFAADYYSPNIATASDVLVITAVASPLLLLLSPDIRSDALTVGTMYAETMLLAAALPGLTKELVDRTRPYAYNSEAPITLKADADTKRSFFSGHTSLAFASAVFLSTVYSDYYPDSEYKPYIWGGTLLVATTVGLLRIFSGKHFPTDVLTGAAVGSFIGWLIPKLHKKTSGNNVTMGVGNMGIAFTYCF
jgi:membrane-associated phospholipid phosphatase